jgi:phosphatidylglycerophosphatase C
MDMTIAAFDVDNTLTVRDCVFPFMVRVAGLPRFLLGTVRHLIPIMKAAFARDRDVLKGIFVSIAFSEADCDRVDDLGVRFASKVAGGWMRSDVAHRLRWHQRQGHVVLLVSASLSPYLEPLGDMLEVDAVLCTRLQSNDGKYTGKIDGANCRGPEKAQRISRWAVDAGLDGDIRLAYAYGDSSGDVQMLALADHPVMVGQTEVATT